MFGFFKKPNQKEFVLLDLSPEAVKTAVIRQNNETVELLGKNEQRLPQGAMFGRKIKDFEAVLETTNFSLQNTFLRLGKKVKPAVFLFSDGGVTGVSLTVKINRKTLESISESELGTLFKTFSKDEKILGRALEMLQNLGFPKGEMELLGSLALSFKADGLPAMSLLDLTAKTLEIVLYLRFINKNDLAESLNLCEGLGLRTEYFWEKVAVLSLGLLGSNQSGLVINDGLNFTDVGGSDTNKILTNLSFDLGTADLRENPESYWWGLLLAARKVLKTKEPPIIFLVKESERLSPQVLSEKIGRSVNVRLLDDDILLTGLQKILS